MTKIVHVSDIHWRGLARHEEYVDAFERLFEYLRLAEPDLIINTGDTFHTKTQNITPEVIEKLAWMFRGMSAIAPTIHILGNHDGNLTNSERQDTITPIHDSLGLKNSFLFKKSGACPLAFEGVFGNLFKDSDIVLHVYSPFDIESWGSIAPVAGKTNIALFHGPVRNATTDVAWRVSGEDSVDVGFFYGMDFVLLGDIHKHQSLSKRADKDGNLKTWIAYPGSLLQQDFGEEETKGFLVWDVRAKDDWDVNFCVLENKAPFLTFPWQGNVFDTIRLIQKDRGTRAFLPGTRFRISSSQPISDIETKQLVNELKNEKKAGEVKIKYEFVSKMDTISTDNHHYHKSSLSTDSGALFSLFKKFIEVHADSLILPDVQQAEPIIKRYVERLANEVDTQRNSVEWSIKSLEFDNLFGYGEGNRINFEKLNGITGLFGPNRIGKSSIVGAVMYSLFNTTDRGSMKTAHIINDQKKSCSAKIRFTIAEQEYLIERQSARLVPKKRSAKKEEFEKTNSVVNFYQVDKNGDLKEMNSISKDDTDKEIRRLIGNPADFMLTSLSRQGDINSFIDAGNTQRKMILSRFLELDVLEKIGLYARDEYNVLNEKSKRYSRVDWTKQIEALENDISVAKNELENLEEKSEAKTNELDQVKSWLMLHESDAKAAKNQDTLKKEIADLRSKIASTTASISDLTATIEKRKAEIESDENAVAAYDVDKLLDRQGRIKSLLERAGEVRQAFKLEEAELRSKEKSVKKLELVPCGDSFPQCHFIKESHENKKTLDSQRDKVAELSTLLSSLEGDIETLVREKIDLSLKEVERLKDRIRTNQSKLAMEEEQMLPLFESNLRLLAEEQKNKQALVLEDSSVMLQEIKQKQTLLEMLKGEIKELEKSKRNLLMSIGSKQEQLATVIREKEESVTVLEQLRLYDCLQQAFSKTGIPAMVLKTQLPAINDELHKILSGAIDFRLSLETDVNSNTMDLYIEDARSRRVIEVASGMEKMISSLALRVALLNLSNLPRPDILIIDEGFGALDQENVVRCMELLSFLKTYFKTILIITHVNDLKDVADSTLEVKFDGQFSGIEV